MHIGSYRLNNSDLLGRPSNANSAVKPHAPTVCVKHVILITKQWHNFSFSAHIMKLKTGSGGSTADLGGAWFQSRQTPTIIRFCRSVILSRIPRQSFETGHHQFLPHPSQLPLNVAVYEMLRKSKTGDKHRNWTKILKPYSKKLPRHYNKIHL
jgi:hypothetical protein